MFLNFSRQKYEMQHTFILNAFMINAFMMVSFCVLL